MQQELYMKELLNISKLLLKMINLFVVSWLWFKDKNTLTLKGIKPGETASPNVVEDKIKIQNRLGKLKLESCFKD